MPEHKPQTEEEYQERRAELINQARQEKAQADAAQSAMLDAVASGDEGIDVERYETVSVGDVQITVKAWMPGGSVESIERAQRLSQRESVDDALEALSVMRDAMTDVTERLEYGEHTVEDKQDIRRFWKGMVDKWGFDGFRQATETVLKPATQNMEEKSEAAQKFRRNR